MYHRMYFLHAINPLNAELNPICHLLALLGAHHILHVSRVRVNSDRQTRLLNVFGQIAVILRDKKPCDLCMITWNKKYIYN